MKKTIFTAAIVLSTTVAITLYSCKKTDATQPQHVEQSSNAAFNVTASNNRLVFNTIADYEKVVTNPTAETEKAFLKTIDAFNNFTSFGEQQNIAPNLRTDKRMQTLIDDDYFKNMLNADLCIQIGKHIFKVNPVTEKVYALPVANAEQYNDLVNENISNTNIQVFSTDDDVLDLIENNEEGTANRKKCNESGIDDKHAWIGDIPVGDYRISLNLDFRKFGIHYSLTAEATTNNNDKVSMSLDMEHVYYHVRCDQTVDYKLYDIGMSNGNFFKSYRGAKNLNELWFEGRIKGVENATGVSAISDWIELRQNK